MLMWSREKKTHYIEKNKDKIKADFLSGAMQAIRLSNDMFKEPKKKLSTQFFFLYQEKNHFKNGEKNKDILWKKLRELFTSRLGTLKEVFQTKGIWFLEKSEFIHT